MTTFVLFLALVADVRPVQVIGWGESDEQLLWGDTHEGKLACDLCWADREAVVGVKVWSNDAREYVLVFATAKVPGRWIGRRGDPCRMRSSERGFLLVQLDGRP